MIIIVPCAGKSSRYPNLRPKWMLTQPNGELMVKEALSGLEIKGHDRLIITVLKEHEEKYEIIDGLKKSFQRNIEVCILEEPTKSQPETVYKTIEKLEIGDAESIFIKDSDNYFELKNLEQNISYVTISSLNNHSYINPSNKSYVIVNENEIVIDIVEKKVISDLFSIGGYFFNKVNHFKMGYKSLLKVREGEFYISDIISYLISKGEVFTIKNGTNYIDWGTIDDWDRFKLNKKTFIIDLDGVIVKNSAKYFKPHWGTTEGIKKNVEAVNTLKKNGHQIIILTSRSEDHRKLTVKQLENINLQYDLLIMGALHSQRILINDFSTSNPFPSAVSINVERDSEQLPHFLKGMGLIKWNE